MQNLFFSIIIPVYNRPNEVEELLESLITQTYTNFEVLIIEDGSTNRCYEIVKSFENRLNIQYFYKENSGQGFSRNYGYERAKGDYFVVFDSDCIIPAHYFEIVNLALAKNYLDAYGGPDKAHISFTNIQKAISYAMTSPFSTGGIRGNKKSIGQFHPRSFNMGISKEVFAKTKGYILPRMGEDIEFSIRIIENGFKVGLIEEAFVYHKRRTSFKQFFKQLHFFGRARINIGRFFKKEIKLVHTFPSLFVLFCLLFLVMPFINRQIFALQGIILAIYIMILGIDALLKTKNIWVSFLSIGAVFVQLFGYGIGFLKEKFFR